MYQTRGRLLRRMEQLEESAARRDAVQEGKYAQLSDEELFQQAQEVVDNMVRRGELIELPAGGYAVAANVPPSEERERLEYIVNCGLFDCGKGTA